MRRTSGKFAAATIGFVLIVVSLCNGAGLFFTRHAAAAGMGARSLELSDSTAGHSGVTYNISFKLTTPGTLGSIELQFCANSTFPTDPCVPPAGLDASSAPLAVQSGISGFLKSSSSTANDIILTRPPAPSAAVTANTRFNNMTNPNSSGSYYLRVITYASNDASGPLIDNGGMAFAMNSTVNVSVEVPPYLMFCVGVTITGFGCNAISGAYIDLGELSPAHTSNGQTQFLTATNAKNGYNVRVTGTTMTSGNDEIPALQALHSAQPGISQFGINLRANASPHVGANYIGPGVGTPTANYNHPNAYFYHDGDVVATSNFADDFRKYTVSYIVNVAASQPPGIYASTFTYICLANF
jgi:hypothetical protein